jgi:cathepsin L
LLKFHHHTVLYDYFQSHEEFSKRHFRAEHFPRSNKLSPTTADTRDPPPPSVDWRTKGVVPPVSNQGVCGDAVGFAVVHSVDSLNAIKTGKLLLASVEEYFDCCTDGSCDGGLYGGASYSCIVDIGGLALESVYVSPDHKCLNDTFPAAIKINGGRFVAPSGSETELAYAVAMQPVVAAVDASHSSFQLYASGVYYDPDCSTHNLDHTVLIVGYGVMENGVEYWICQNSWGTTWGMEGYILMARNRDNNCGIATNASYPY